MILEPIFVDYFAGGGGASEGAEQAMGRSVDVAVNHDPEAIAVHEANHPGTQHFCQSVYAIDPLDVAGGRRVGGAWFSPDCKHFSKAKGAVPVDKRIRDLADIVPHFIKRLGPTMRPTVIWLENVEEFRTWGPLDANGKPCKIQKGKSFDAWVAKIRRAGYQVQWRELRACDYGAPTSRKRLFVIARCDKRPIVWPKPTHGKPGTPEVLSGQRLPWRTAAECIDWSIPCPSIFERKRPLKDATCRRIAAGIMRYVVNSSRPFIVPVTHSGDMRVHSVDDPLRTVTTANGGELAVVAPILERQFGKSKGADIDEPMPTAMPGGGGKTALVSATIVGVGGRRAQSGPVDPDGPYPTTTAKADAAIVAAFLHKYRRNSDGQSLEDPAPTITANSFIKRPGGAPPLAVTVAHLAQFNTNPGGTVNAGHSAEEPLSTVATRGPHQALVASSLVKLRGTSKDGQPVDEPLHTISAGGKHFAQVLAFLVKYYGAAEHGQTADKPLDAITAKARFGLVTVTIDGEEYAIVDIGMRMLTPRELARAQGFPDTYILDPVCDRVTKSGRKVRGRLPIASQIRMIGNSVCPPMSKALIEANAPEMCITDDREAA
jgi:DNA (cytosine-5)-methyltransferase 1